MFFTLFGYWLVGWGGGGAPKGMVHSLLIQFFTLDSFKMEVFKTCFFDIVTTQYDHPSYLKHVLGRIYMVFTLFGIGLGGGGGGSQGNGTQPAYAVFHHGQLQNGSFQNFFFDIVTTHYDHPSYLKHILGRIYMFFTLFGYGLGWGGGGSMTSYRRRRRCRGCCSRGAWWTPTQSWQPPRAAPPCVHTLGCGGDAPPALTGCWWTPAWQPCCAGQRCCRRAASHTIARCTSNCPPRGRCRVWSSSCACPGWSFRPCQRRRESLWCRACWTPWGPGGTRSWQPGTWTACGQRGPGRRRRRCWRSESQGPGRARSYPRLPLITRGAGAQCGC